MTHADRLDYSVAQRVLHWSTLLLVFFNLLLPGSIERVADLLDEGKTPSPSEWTSADLHIYSGFAILGLTVLRLLLRAIQGSPGAPIGEPPMFHFLGKASHALFYAVLIIMPGLGIAKFYLGIDAAGGLHGGPVKLILWALIVGHVGAVLVHQFYWKTNALARMTKGSS